MVRDVLIFNKPQRYSQAELEHKLLLLPQWRRDYALSFRRLIDRINCCEAYLLLKRGLLENYGIDSNPFLAYEVNGKPYLKDYPGIDFCISHCNNGVLCVIADEPVGCDIEDIPQNIDDLLYNNCFCPSEQMLIHDSEKPEVEYTKLWTMKEAALKLTGDGLSCDLQFLLQTMPHKEYKYESKICEQMGYVFTICQNR